MTPLLLLLLLWPHFKAIKLDVFFSYVKNEQAANKKWKKLTGSEWFSEYEDGYEVTFFPSYIFIYLAFISFWLLVGLVVFHCIKVILLIISFSRSRIRVLVRRNWISCGYLARKRRKHSTWLAKDLKGASTVRVTRWRRPSDYKELMMASFLTWKTIQPSRLQRYERIAMTSMKMAQF